MEEIEIGNDIFSFFVGSAGFVVLNRISYIRDDRFLSCCIVNDLANNAYRNIQRASMPRRDGATNCARSSFEQHPNIQRATMSQRDGATNCARSLFEQHPIMERQGLLHRGEVAPFHHEKRHTWKWLVYPCLFLLNEKLFDTFHRCIGSGTLVVG